MTDRQRAFVSALTYVVKLNNFVDYHRVGVRRLPLEVMMYEFRGAWQKNNLSIYDDKENKIHSHQFYKDPWGVQITWQGKKRTEQLKIILPDGLSIRGEDGDYFKFNGRYYSPDKVEIKDYSQDTDRYVYRVVW